MIPTPPNMLKAPYSSLYLLFWPLKWAQNYLQHILSFKKTKRKNSWCSGLCPSPLVGSMRSLAGSWIVCWDDYSPCALSFASLVIFIATWFVSFCFPGLYIISKSYPCNFVVHFCCFGVWIVWDRREFKLFWSGKTRWGQGTPLNPWANVAVAILDFL